jgi:hypothetical protein
MRNNIPFSFEILAFLSLVLPSSLQCLYVCDLVLVRDEKQRRTLACTTIILYKLKMCFIHSLLNNNLPLLSALNFHFNVLFFRFDPLHKFGFSVSPAVAMF